MIKRGILLLPALLVAALMTPFVPSQSAVAAPTSRVVAQGGPVACRTFPETGQTVGGNFLAYWRDHGGLAQQGYPIASTGVEVSETDGQTYQVQYFERAVFEYHPNNTAPNDVLLSLLGSFAYKQRYPDGAPNQTPNQGDGAQFFPETGHWVGGGFLDYWANNGGLAQQGYPISDEFDEVSPENGQVYRVQYFERAVFEYHPENNPGNRILLSLLGKFRLQNNYGGAFPANQIVQLDCAPDTDGDGVLDQDEDANCVNLPENINGIFDTDGCPDDISTLISVAAEDINTYWQQEFDISEIRYFPPNEIVPYNTPIRTACGRAVPQNAFYCPFDHTIYYDIDFLQSELENGGDFAPVVIIAHEWGHLVQGNLGLLDANVPTIYTELQADCFAGSWTKYVRDGNSSAKLDQGDIDEGINALFRAGDDSDTPWFDEGAHGQPSQRVHWFNVGLDSGVEPCFDIQDINTP